MIDVFVSHSSQDQTLAKRLVDLFRSALTLRADQIRCTSVDGYRLPVGSDSDEQLRQEILGARAFVGILSPSSLASAYVLFELGARWGAGKQLAPVLAPATTPRDLRGPIAGLNSLRSDSSEQLHQLVQDLGSVLGIPPEAPQVYGPSVDSVLAIAHAAPRAARRAAPQGGFQELSNESKLCPKCSKQSWILAASERDRVFGDVGGVRRTYKCVSCGFSEPLLVVPE